MRESRERLLFAPYPRPKQGNENADPIYLAIGRALSSWEATEDNLARLFSHIVNQNKLQMPVMRAYLLIKSARNRKELITETGRTFLEFFPSEEAAHGLKIVSETYQRGSDWRNEIAHGIVAGHVDFSGSYSGYYLGPSMTSFKKRDDNFRSKYLYSNKEIGAFCDENSRFQSNISELTEAITAAYRSGSDVAFSRY